LTSYGASECTAGANPCAGHVCTGGFTTFPIPLDASLPSQVPQQAGNFVVYNGSITTTTGYSTGGSGVTVTKLITISGVAASGSGTKDVLILYGGHLARHTQWILVPPGNNDGAK